jgi:hypothetical protein
MQEIGLDEELALLKQAQYNIGGRLYTIDVKFTFDWMSGVPVLGSAVPSHRFADAAVCGWCDVTKGELNEGWREADPFRWHTCIDAPTSLLPSLNRSDCRYCAMHGCTRMLCGALQSLRAAAPRGQRGPFAAVISRVRRGWNSKAKLRCCEMKLILDDPVLLRDAAALFGQHYIELQQPNGQLQRLQLRHAVHLLLDSIRVFRQFSYLRIPRSSDFGVLLSARTAYISFYLAMAWKIAPAPHFMLNHFIDFSLTDRTAFFTLQEGAEHKHHDDRTDIKTTLGKGKLHDHNGYQHLLDQQETRRQLVQLGYGPPRVTPARVITPPSANEPALVAPVHTLYR